MSEIEVIHNIKKQVFSVTLNEQICELKYHREGNLLDMYHTFVPDSLRGKGIAGKIAAAALDYVQKNNFTVKPSCPYVKKFMDLHPEFQNLMHKN